MKSLDNRSLLIFLVLIMVSQVNENYVCYAMTQDGLYNLPLPVKHPVHLFLQRMEGKGLISFHSNIRPLTRGEITGYLLEVYRSNQQNPVQYNLSLCEKRELSRFIQEFLRNNKRLTIDEITNLNRLRQKVWSKSPFYRDGLNLYNFTVNGVYTAINPVLYWDALTDSTGEVILKRANGLNFITGLSTKVGVYFDFRDNMETGRGPYNRGERDKLYSDRAGYVTMDGGNVCYYDLTRAILALKWGNLLLDFGRGDNSWGSGSSGNFLLSDNPPPFDFVSARYDVGKLLRFIYVTGWLHPYPEIYQDSTIVQGRTRKILAHKFIAAHRLEIYPYRGIEFGLCESVIYGERGMEPSYLNPINLYYSAQHNLGDMDNVAWQGDFEVHPLKGISLYGELFIDDMRTGELGTDYVGNKFAYLGGLFWVNPFGLENLDITAEYCRLDPFVYTHIYPINTYKNWNSSLGYFLPPNSERNFLGIRWHPDYCWTAILSACFVRYGANSDSVNVGGDIDLPPEVGITTAPFLAGKRINISTLEAMIKWEPLEYYSVTGYWRWHHWSGGYQNEWHFTIGVNVW